MSSDGTSITVAETVLDGEYLPELVDSLDFSMYTPIEKILLVDLRSNLSGEVEDAMKKLAKLCYDGTADERSQNRTTIYQNATAITIAMSHWRAFPDIQAEGCKALAFATHGNSAFEKAAKDAGALKAVTWAMKAYPNNLKVQWGACGAIYNLVNGVKKNAQYFVVARDTIDLIVAAMQKFPNHVRLQLYSCTALCTFSKWDQGKDAVKRAGGRLALVYAMENHPDTSKQDVQDLHKRASLALYQLIETHLPKPKEKSKSETGKVLKSKKRS